MSESVYVQVLDLRDGTSPPRSLVWRIPLTTYNKMKALMQVKEEKPMEYVCADCGTKTDQFNEPCVSCGGRRISLISVIEKLLGPNWYEIGFGDQNVGD